LQQSRYLERPALHHLVDRLYAALHARLAR
jgi:hypothetical protein